MTNDEKIPLKVRPHLLSFLYEEFEGKEARYEGAKALSVNFQPHSSIAKYIKNNFKCTKNTSLFLYIKIEKNGLEKSGQIYYKYKGVINPLLVDIHVSDDFNTLIEDMFRLSLNYYLKGLTEQGSTVNDAIWKFIDKYNLLECGFDYENIRQLYYRHAKRPALKRFQVKTSNRVGYHVTA